MRKGQLLKIKKFRQKRRFLRQHKLNADLFLEASKSQTGRFERPVCSMCTARSYPKTTAISTCYQYHPKTHSVCSLHTKPAQEPSKNRKGVHAACPLQSGISCGTRKKNTLEKPHIYQWFLLLHLFRMFSASRSALCML